MERALFLLTCLGVLGAGLNAGLFFAFSAMVMPGLARLPAANGIAAMQAINVAVLNPVFFVVFFGTGAVSALIVIGVVLTWPDNADPLLIGSLFYLIGTLGVTFTCNVPLNDNLAAVAPDHGEAEAFWTKYCTIWTSWNHARAGAAFAAMAALVWALMPA